MIIDLALDQYLLACEADGLSPATVKWYGSLLSVFVGEFPDQELAGVTAPMLRQFIVGLRNRDQRYVGAAQKPPQAGGLSDSSIAGHVRALHAFWSWCEREYDLEHNPMSNVRRIKNPEPKPKAITAADFIKLFEAAGDNAAGMRDRALLVFLADTGCRLGGLLSLTLDNLFLNDRRAIVTEKGDQTRSVVYTAYTCQIMRHWLEVRSSTSRAVFISMVTGKALTQAGVHMAIKRLKTRAKVTGRVNPHSFRHNFAREYLRNGGDLATLARLLGHSNISTTAAYYAVFSQDELADLHEKYSPITGLIVNKEKE